MSITGLYTCPVCPQNIRLKSQHSNITVCESCKTPVKLLEQSMFVSKKYSVITDNDSIIQPGSWGVFEAKKFTVLGRFRLWQKEGVYNYWTILWNDQSVGYLVEGYGLYALYEPVELESPINKVYFNEVPGKEVPGLKRGSVFFTQQYSEAVRWDIEGEIWLADDEEAIKTYHLQDSGSTSIEVIFFGNRISRAFNVRHTSFESLGLQQLRSTERSKLYKCTECGTDIVLHTRPYSQSCACDKCRSCFVISKLDQLNLKTKGKTHAFEPVLKPGIKGSLFDKEYAVLGWVQKKESPGSSEYKWTEYTLYNPEQGFSFLSEFEGHWILIKEMGNGPLLAYDGTKEVRWRDSSFELFNKYHFQTINASGEFPYNIFNDNKIIAREFIAPPQMLVYEKSNEEGIVWYHGQHVERDDIKKAFDVFPPYQSGVGAIQPKGFVDKSSITITFFIGLFFLVTIHLFFAYNSREKNLFDRDYTFPMGPPASNILDDSALNAQVFSGFSVRSGSITAVTEKFVLDEWKSSVKFSIDAPVSNSWLEVNLTLVNAETGQEYSVEQGVEEYHGYSDGENWEEGGTSESVLLSSIPKGTYFVEIQALRDGNSDLSHFYLRATYDAPIHRNLLMIILLFAVWPLVKLISINYNERKRWYNSPFTPYSYEDQ